MSNHGTRICSNPFDDGPSDSLQNTEDTEYIPIQIPENNRPHSPRSSKKTGGAQWNRPLITRIKMKMKSCKKLVKIIKILKKPKKVQIIHHQMTYKKPRKFPKYSLARRTHKYPWWKKKQLTS